MRGFALTLIFVIFIMAFALYLQIFQQIMPCPLCILQRIAYIGIAIICLIALIHRPKVIACRIYVGLTLILASFGFLMTARQIFLQLNLTNETNTCGPSFDYMFHNLSLQKFIDTLFQGSGSCTSISWTFMHLSLAEWSALGFIGIITLLIWQWRLASALR